MTLLAATALASGALAAPPVTRVTVALIALEGGSIGCGDGIVPVPLTLPHTRAPLAAALRALLAHRARTGAGQYDALRLSTLRLDSASIKAGVATIRLSGSLVLNGVCDNPRVEAQLVSTARQFPTVRSVRVFLNGEPLSTALWEK
jgi:spore germination protein GerM